MVGHNDFVFVHIWLTQRNHEKHTVVSRPRNKNNPAIDQLRNSYHNVRTTGAYNTNTHGLNEF